jgi:hypothetical protein
MRVDQPDRQVGPLFGRRASGKGWRRVMVDLLGHARLLNAVTLARCRARVLSDAAYTSRRSGREGALYYLQDSLPALVGPVENLEPPAQGLPSSGPRDVFRGIRDAFRGNPGRLWAISPGASMEERALLTRVSTGTCDPQN